MREGKQLDALCIAKGKARKKYESGRKASVAMLRDSCVIVSTTSYSESIYDGDTLEETLEQARDITGKTFGCVPTDKGYRGRGGMRNSSGDTSKAE